MHSPYALPTYGTPKQFVGGQNMSATVLPEKHSAARPRGLVPNREGAFDRQPQRGQDGDAFGFPRWPCRRPLFCENIDNARLRPASARKVEAGSEEMSRWLRTTPRQDLLRKRRHQLRRALPKFRNARVPGTAKRNICLASGLKGRAMSASSTFRRVRDFQTWWIFRNSYKLGLSGRRAKRRKSATTRSVSSRNAGGKKVSSNSMR